MFFERKDRNASGCGIGCYIKGSISYTRRSDLEQRNLEVLWIEIKLKQSQPWFVCIVYRPPNSTIDFFETLENNIERANDITSNIVVLSDLNCNILVKKHTF